MAAVNVDGRVVRVDVPRHHGGGKASREVRIPVTSKASFEEVLGDNEPELPTTGGTGQEERPLLNIEQLARLIQTDTGGAASNKVTACIIIT